jgi:dTDP-4-amino-4,6-dideoxygalactose transaminase
MPEKGLEYVTEAFRSGKVSGDGLFTKRCETFLAARYESPRMLMTTSCTDALELAALLCGVRPGDEVILPSFTFVSTANAFALRGAKLVFVDSLPGHPNLDPERIREMISARTKVIVPVHYAGVAADLTPILEMAHSLGAFVIEDAAQAIEGTYRGQPLGTIGDLGAFSFHETKNVHCGEGGLLAIRGPAHAHRAEILREKGTNRSAFFRGEIDKYGWIDVGSSFLPSDILAALLWAQLENLGEISTRRHRLWRRYFDGLYPLQLAGWLSLPSVPAHAQHNAHAFYLVLGDEETRARLINHLKANGIMAVFHYQALHASPYFVDKHDGRPLPNAIRFSECLLRLPLFHDLQEEEQNHIIKSVMQFFGMTPIAASAPHDTSS